jgi:hypothetical protein
MDPDVHDWLNRFAFEHRWTLFTECAFNQYYPRVHNLHGNVYLDEY